jgi:hypothetical protein
MRDVYCIFSLLQCIFFLLQLTTKPHRPPPWWRPVSDSSRRHLHHSRRYLPTIVSSQSPACHRHSTKLSEPAANHRLVEPITAPPLHHSAHPIDVWSANPHPRRSSVTSNRKCAHMWPTSASSHARRQQGKGIVNGYAFALQCWRRSWFCMLCISKA